MLFVLVIIFVLLLLLAGVGNDVCVYLCRWSNGIGAEVAGVNCICLVLIVLFSDAGVCIKPQQYFNTEIFK